MEENFDLALEKVLKYEGGFSNHPKDRGGSTNLGITLNTLKDFYAEYDYGDFSEDGQIDLDDLRMLTPELASPIYRKAYWAKMKLDTFPPGVDFLMFDFGVNSGPRNAIRILQKAINRYTKNPIDTDGALGPQTIERLNGIDPSLIVEAMLKERNIFYNKLIVQNPSQEVFRNGWFNRLDNVSEEVQEFMG